MENNIFDFLSVDRQKIVCHFTLQDIKQIEQTLQSQIRKINESNEKIILKNCIKYNTLIVTTDYFAYFKIPIYQPFIECQIIDYEKLHQKYLNVSNKYTLIKNEYYSQTIILNRINEICKLKPIEIALLFNVSLTTAYKIITLANSNFEFIEFCAINFIPIDLLNNLLKKYNFEVIEYAFNFINNNKLSIYEVEEVIKQIYKEVEE